MIGVLAIGAIACGPSPIDDVATRAAQYRGYSLLYVAVETPEAAASLAAAGATPIYDTEEGTGHYLLDAAGRRALLRDGIPHQVLVDDVERQILDENSRWALLGAPAPEDPAEVWYAEYRSPDDYLERIRHVGRRAGVSTVQEVGSSAESRQVLGLTIAAGAGKPGLFLLGGQHANEWIGGAVTMYVADQLDSLYGRDPRVTDLLDQVQVLAVPMANPDGYAWARSGNRSWRFSRRQLDELDADDPTCVGVDLNRNWAIPGWRVQGGCGGGYSGPRPFSESETEGPRQFAQAVDGLVAFIDYHCCGEELLYPYSYTAEANADLSSFMELTGVMRAAVGDQYVVGSGRDFNHTGVGTSKDWAYDERHLWALTAELSATANNNSVGIIPSGEAHLRGVLALMEWLVTREVAVVVDNRDPGAAAQGTWEVSGAAGFFGDDSVYSKEADATFTFAAPLRGAHQVGLRWTAWASRCSAVHVDVREDGAILGSAIVDQSQNAGAWLDLGSFQFESSAEVVVHSVGESCSTCADAVRFVAVEEPPGLDAGPAPDVEELPDAAGSTDVGHALDAAEGADVRHTPDAAVEVVPDAAEGADVHHTPDAAVEVAPDAAELSDLDRVPDAAELPDLDRAPDAEAEDDAALPADAAELAQRDAGLEQGDRASGAGPSPEVVESVTVGDRFTCGSLPGLDGTGGSGLALTALLALSCRRRHLRRR